MTNFKAILGPSSTRLPIPSLFWKEGGKKRITPSEVGPDLSIRAAGRGCTHHDR